MIRMQATMNTAMIAEAIGRRTFMTPCATGLYAICFPVVARAHAGGLITVIHTAAEYALMLAIVGAFVAGFLVTFCRNRLSVGRTSPHMRLSSVPTLPRCGAPFVSFSRHPKRRKIPYYTSGVFLR
jgi:hypothetical protein